MVLRQLRSEGLLPAIVFVFSRKGCNEAVKQCLAAGVRLTDDAQRKRIKAHVNRRVADLPSEDLAVLGFYDWRDGLERGVAAHHAGMLPMFKEIVEELFTKGLLQAVFATETLALGINMPARSVVLERMVKWNGSAHADITAGEYTQLTGRAGRRGIDVEGHAVTVWHGGLDPHGLAGLASTRTYPLKSSFGPSYNMAVNLVARIGRRAARDLLETSFAQFQADAGVVGLANQIRKHDQALAGYAQSMTCHLGEFSEYAGLRRQLAQRERDLARDGAARRRLQVEAQLVDLKIGDVIVLSTGRRAGLALVVEAASRSDDEPRPSVLTVERRVKRLNAVDVPHGVAAISQLKIPRNFDPRSANWRRDLARTLAEHANTLEIRRPRKSSDGQTAADTEIANLRAQLRAHSCHGCSDREAHARWAERYAKLETETKQLRKRIESRTNTVAREFDRVCAVLADLGYLAEVQGKTVVTDDGHVLARLYSDQDLLAAQCLRNDVWRGLSPSELAGACAALVYESRTPDDGMRPSLPPSNALRDAIADQEDLADELAERESRHRLSFVREPNAGFSNAAWEWAQGDALDSVLRGSDLAPGDFVRWCRQLIDLLSQVAEATTDRELSQNARIAVEELRRGVVAYAAVV
jgi:ATP-dependent RNA helicase HelY